MTLCGHPQNAMQCEAGNTPALMLLPTPAAPGAFLKQGVKTSDHHACSATRTAALLFEAAALVHLCKQMHAHTASQLQKLQQELEQKVSRHHRGWLDCLT